MPEVFGRSYSRSELHRRVGHLSQVGGVQLLAFESGQSRGVQFLEFRTGSGLIYKVAIDRGMDIGYCEFKGKSLAWIPPTQMPAPWYFGEQSGFGWLRSALGGLMNTCGLEHIGNPATVNVEHHKFPARPVAKYGVHDRIAQTPAKLISYGERWEGDECYLEAVAEVNQAQPFGENLRLIRSVSSHLGSSSIKIADHVQNVGFSSSRHMLLYHLNFGFPFVRENSSVILRAIPGSTTQLSSSDGPHIHEEWTRIVEPGHERSLHVFQHEPEADADGLTRVGILNRDEKGDFCEGLFVRYNVSQLPVLYQSHIMAEGFYSVIVEPASVVMDLDVQNEADRKLWLQPDESRAYDLEIGVLEDAQACQDFLHEAGVPQ